MNNFQEKVAKYSVLGVEMESFALLLNAKLLNKKATTCQIIARKRKDILIKEKIDWEKLIQI